MRRLIYLYRLIRPFFPHETTEDVLRRDRRRALLIAGLAVIVSLATLLGGHVRP